MPRDALYEESAQPINQKRQAKLYMTFHVLFIVFGVIALLHALVCVTFLPGWCKGLRGWALAIYLIMWLGLLAAFALTSFLFFRLRLRFNVSYDYIFVQDELRITKVFNGRKRRHVVTLEADHILQVGYCEGDAFERTYAGLNGAKPRVMSPNSEPAEGKDFIHILYSNSLGKTMYILECKKELLEYVVFAVGRNKFVNK